MDLVIRSSIVKRVLEGGDSKSKAFVLLVKVPIRHLVDLFLVFLQSFGSCIEETVLGHLDQLALQIEILLLFRFPVYFKLIFEGTYNN